MSYTLSIDVTRPVLLYKTLLTLLLRPCLEGKHHKILPLHRHDIGQSWFLVSAQHCCLGSGRVFWKSNRRLGSQRLCTPSCRSNYTTELIQNSAAAIPNSRESSQPAIAVIGRWNFSLNGPHPPCPVSLSYCEDCNSAPVRRDSLPSGAHRFRVWPRPRLSTQSISYLSRAGDV